MVDVLVVGVVVDRFEFVSALFYGAAGGVGESRAVALTWPQGAATKHGT